MNYLLNFKKNLRFLREKKNLTRPELAELLGISIHRMGEIEYSNLKQPNLEELVNIANLFGVKIDALTGDQPFPKRITLCKSPPYKAIEEKETIILNQSSAHRLTRLAKEFASNMKAIEEKRLNSYQKTEKSRLIKGEAKQKKINPNLP